MKALVLRYLHTPAVHARMPHFKTMCTSVAKGFLSGKLLVAGANAAVLKYAACRSHVLTSGGNRSKVKVAIPMRSMYDRGSEWRQNCADVKHLPAELARYIRDTYSEYWVAGQFPKIGGQALSWQQIVDLCAKVQPCQRGISLVRGFVKATGARKRIWRCSMPWKLYVPEYLGR